MSVQKSTLNKKVSRWACFLVMRKGSRFDFARENTRRVLTQRWWLFYMQVHERFYYKLQNKPVSRKISVSSTWHQKVEKNANVALSHYDTFNAEHIAIFFFARYSACARRKKWLTRQTTSSLVVFLRHTTQQLVHMFVLLLRISVFTENFQPATSSMRNITQLLESSNPDGVENGFIMLKKQQYIHLRRLRQEC